MESVEWGQLYFIGIIFSSEWSLEKFSKALDNTQWNQVTGGYLLLEESYKTPMLTEKYYVHKKQCLLHLNYDSLNWGWWP